MTPKVPLLFAILALALATLAVARAFAPTQIGISELAELRQEVASIAARQPVAPQAGRSSQQLAAELVALRAEVIDLRRELAARRQQPAPTTVLAGPNDPSGFPSGMVPSPESASGNEELGMRLDRALLSGANSLDARRLANEISATLARVLPQRAVLRDISCAAAVCRAEISYANAEQLQSFLETQLSGGDDSFWQGPVFLRPTTEPLPLQGEVRALLYLGRDAAGFEAVEAS